MLGVISNRDDDHDALAAVRAFASAIPRGSWFAACGEPLTESERADAAAYLAALGLPGSAVAGVAGWVEARAVTQDAAWSRGWWAAEACAQAALRHDAEARFGAERLLSALT